MQVILVDMTCLQNVPQCLQYFSVLALQYFDFFCKTCPFEYCKVYPSHYSVPQISPLANIAISCILHSFSLSMSCKLCPAACLATTLFPTMCCILCLSSTSCKLTSFKSCNCIVLHHDLHTSSFQQVLQVLSA